MSRLIQPTLPHNIQQCFGREGGPANCTMGVILFSAPWTFDELQNSSRSNQLPLMLMGIKLSVGDFFHPNRNDVQKYHLN